MKERYEKLTHENNREELNDKVDAIHFNLFGRINDMNRCKTRLMEIA